MSEETLPSIGGRLPDLGPIVLAGAKADLAAPTIETSPNWSPRIQVMLAAVGIFTPATWNAAAVTMWILAAAEAQRRTSPIVGGTSGSTGLYVVEQFKRKKRWLPKDVLTIGKIKPGMVAASKESASSSTVLVGIVKQVAANGHIYCIDGDAGTGHDRVSLRDRLLGDPLFLGIGFV